MIGMDRRCDERLDKVWKRERRRNRGRRTVDASKRHALEANLVQRRCGIGLAADRVDAMLQLMLYRLLLRKQQQD